MSLTCVISQGVGLGGGEGLLFRALLPCQLPSGTRQHLYPLSFPSGPSHPETAVSSSCVMYESKDEEDSRLLLRLEAQVVLEDRINLHVSGFPCRINGFMRITVPSVVHELSETVFWSALQFF